MPLLGIDLGAVNLTQRCALCGATNSIPLGGLVLGTSGGGLVNADAIRLPPCPTCKAQEILARNWDVTPLGYRNGPHCEQRAAVNALGQYLKTKGQQDSAAKPLHDKEAGDPPEIMDIAAAKVLLLVPNVPGERDWNTGILGSQSGSARPAIRYGK